MLSWSVVVVVAFVASGHAYRSGAPVLRMDMMMNSMCTIGNLRPNHRENNRQIMPQFGPAPFQLRVEQPHFPYAPGRKVKVTLSANTGKTFKGFFITGDGEDAKTGFGGKFEPVPPNAAKPTKFCVQGITHIDPKPKTSVSVFWSPPANYTHGKVQFKATVVENFRTFYTGVLSNAINADTSLDTQSQYAQKQMQQMFANGGPGGMFNMREMMSNMNKMMGNMGGGQHHGGGPGHTGGPGGGGALGSFFQNLG